MVPLLNRAFLTVVEFPWAREDRPTVYRGGGLSEYVQLAVLMALMVAILIGSYGFLLKVSGSPNQAQKERQSRRESEAD